MPRKLRMAQSFKPGFSMVEVLVSVAILIMIIASVIFYLRSGVNEEAQLDARAMALHNYISLRAHLRQDILEAHKIEVLNENSVKLYLLEVDEDFNEIRKEVSWSSESAKRVVRSEAGKKRVFDFSDSISSTEMIRIRFSMDQ